MDKENNQSQKTKNALAFVPVYNIIMFFLEKDKTLRFDKNIKYSLFIFSIYFILVLVFPFSIFWMLFVIYMWVSWFFAYKAYAEQDIDIKFLDDILYKE